MADIQHRLGVQTMNAQLVSREVRVQVCKRNICRRKHWPYCCLQKIYLHFLKVAAGGEELSGLEERLIAAAPQELQQVLSEVVHHLCGPAAVCLPELQVFSVDFDPVCQLRGDGGQLLCHS